MYPVTLSKRSWSSDPKLLQRVKDGWSSFNPFSVLGPMLALAITQQHLYFDAWSRVHAFELLFIQRHSEESAIHLLPHAQAHRYPWLANVTVIDGETESMTSFSLLVFWPQMAMASSGFTLGISRRTFFCWVTREPRVTVLPSHCFSALKTP